MHETNRFVPMRTDYEYYSHVGESPPLAGGEEIFERLTWNSYGTSGFLDEMRDEHASVPFIWGSVGAGGYVTDDAFERIVGELVGGLLQALPVDAAAPDGAEALLVNAMNVAREEEANFNLRYDEEHLPALSAVSGTLAARW